MRQPENEYMNHKLVLNANIKPYYHNHCRPIKEEEKNICSCMLLTWIDCNMARILHKVNLLYIGNKFQRTHNMYKT